MENDLNLSEGGYFKVEKGKTKLDLERLLEILEFSRKLVEKAVLL